MSGLKCNRGQKQRISSPHTSLCKKPVKAFETKLVTLILKMLSNSQGIKALIIE